MLLDSPSSHWSGSAGAIYPLLARFEGRGFVTSRKSMRGDRAGWLYALKAAGRKRFLEWIGPPLADEVVTIAADPLRTRVHYLSALPARRRAAFLSAARAALERHMEQLVPIADMDEFDLLALDGGIRLTRARIQWLEQVSRALAKPMRNRG
jgi:DNA-binding PadR family transcriptional regulator